MSDFESIEALEEEKRAARELLASQIPFPIWLGLAPRLAGDLEFYHTMTDTLHWLAKHGTATGFRSNGSRKPMLTTESVTRDENGMFYFDEDGSLAPYPENS